ncbi:uncharacterized protein Triagg1_7550 [Trichoderma aggressivum f. europaeum]|uniref:AAA+ ATPase domain-containing protein n=1 Tax=Trichoderma aggressivum f. europaeum TaxID=173218 RepID=A0AAE1M2U9_9HYPO|nr:hypothetical protein Triagg1_7550 [Trichoderma aggressivum f. europaeum]
MALDGEVNEGGLAWYMQQRFSDMYTYTGQNNVQHLPIITHDNDEQNNGQNGVSGDTELPATSLGTRDETALSTGWRPPNVDQLSPPMIRFLDTTGDQIANNTAGYHEARGHPYEPSIISDQGVSSTYEDIQKHRSVNGKGPTLKLPIEVDRYSEAEQSILEKGSVAPSWAAKHKPGEYNDDSDADDAKDPHNADDDVYDSDLDSQRSQPNRTKREHHKKMREWRSKATTRFEKMLLDCIVNTDEIAPDYKDVVVDLEVIMKLEDATRLSLQRRRAFSHGVLKGNRITGAILWGPPGTGKTLLVRALARQSEFNMLSVSTAELWQKCHGEDEKVIKAVFSMGRKLSPCIIFLDEADAMLGTRKAGEKRHIRAMFNQFLMEWDGLISSKQAPFLLLATNRPFDLDPAVLRRAPMQIHMDLPNPNERLEIIKRLLADETLERGMTYHFLSQQTQLYSGSDLKNLCVTAATLCVREQKEDTEKRILTRKHFIEALETIKPTNMTKVMKNELQKFEKNVGQNENNQEEE